MHILFLALSPPTEMSYSPANQKTPSLSRPPKTSGLPPPSLGRAGLLHTTPRPPSYLAPPSTEVCRIMYHTVPWSAVSWPRPWPPPPPGPAPYSVLCTDVTYVRVLRILRFKLHGCWAPMAQAHSVCTCVPPVTVALQWLR